MPGLPELADRLAHDRRPPLILMHGVSGSGKTWHSQRLLERLGAVRLRSDVERSACSASRPGNPAPAYPAASTPGSRRADPGPAA
ncbi:MAG: AAA family ATPase [Hydrogenophilales bacterium]|nr:AAA family ATPase [Hydrogenophilales bacterium]